MPRTPGLVNNEFVATDSSSRSPVVLCRHCRNARVAKSSSKRKVAHLRRCVAYRSFLGDAPMPFEPEGDDDDDDEPRSVAATTTASTTKPVVKKKGYVDALPLRWPLGHAIKPDTTALIVLDMQRDFCEHGGLLANLRHPITAARSIIPPILQLLHACRTVRLPVYHVRHSHRHDLSTLSGLDRTRVGALPMPPAPQSDAAGKSQAPSRPPLPVPGTQGPLGHFLLRQSPGTDPVVELCPLYHEVLVDHPRSSAFAYTDFDLLLRNRDISNLIIVGLDVDHSIISTTRDAIDKRYDCALVAGCIAQVSSPFPTTDPPATPEQVADLSLSESAANAALDTVVPPNWRCSNTGTILPFAALMAALADITPLSRAGAPSQPRTYTSPYHNAQPALVAKPPTPQVTHAVPIAPSPPVPRIVPGGRAGAGGRRGRGINDPIFYQPPKGGIRHPQRPNRTNLAKRVTEAIDQMAGPPTIKPDTDPAVDERGPSENVEREPSMDGLFEGIRAEANGVHPDHETTSTVNNHQHEPGAAPGSLTDGSDNDAAEDMMEEDG